MHNAYKERLRFAKGMPHQCVRCGAIYEDTDEAILKGCSCGSRLFFYIRKERLEEARQRQVSLTRREREQMEKDIIQLLGDEAVKDEPVILDFESVLVLKPGQYELDLVKLFKHEPVVFKLGDGKYYIDLKQSFTPQRRKQSRG